MEPRPEGRGDLSIVGVGLSGSSCFNGAAARRPRRRGTDTEPTRQPRLQWSRGPKAAETPGRRTQWPPHQPCFNGAAARRPRRRALLVLGVEVSAASMEPRPEGRGDIRAANSARICWRLQWSRGPKAAETGGRFRGASDAGLLQWSRGPKAAETRASCIAVSPSHALQWSRGPKAAETTAAASRSPSVAKLQWSRGPKAAETPHEGASPGDACEASMEPRPEGRGDYRRASGRCRRPDASMEPRPEGRGD